MKQHICFLVTFLWCLSRRGIWRPLQTPTISSRPTVMGRPRESGFGFEFKRAAAIKFLVLTTFHMTPTGSARTSDVEQYYTQDFAGKPEGTKSKVYLAFAL